MHQGQPMPSLVVMRLMMWKRSICIGGSLRSELVWWLRQEQRRSSQISLDCPSLHSSFSAFWSKICKLRLQDILQWAALNFHGTFAAYIMHCSDILIRRLGSKPLSLGFRNRQIKWWQSEETKVMGRVWLPLYHLLFNNALHQFGAQHL